MKDDTPNGVCEHLLEAIESLRAAHRESLNDEEKAAIRSAVMMIRYLIEQASQ